MNFIDIVADITAVDLQASQKGCVTILAMGLSLGKISLEVVQYFRRCKQSTQARCKQFITGKVGRNSEEPKQQKFQSWDFGEAH